MQAFANNHFVCFSSQNLPYSGASDFVLWGSSPYNPKNNKKAIRYKYLMTILVRFVQTYSVFKQIAKSICNEYSICFSSQNLPYGGASDFVKVCYAHHHNIIKTRNILKNIPRFWYAVGPVTQSRKVHSSKHTPWLRRNASICQQSLRMFLLSKSAVQWCVRFCIMGFESLQP